MWGSSPRDRRDEVRLSFPHPSLIAHSNILDSIGGQMYYSSMVEQIAVSVLDYRFVKALVLVQFQLIHSQVRTLPRRIEFGM
jgi:hypothetical protein